MTVFECVRCNALFYSASRAAVRPCQECGSGTVRVLSEPSFQSAAQAQRTPAPGDHSFAIYRDAAQAARLAAPFVEEGVRRGARTVVQLGRALAADVERLLSEEAVTRTRWLGAGWARDEDFDPVALAQGLRELARADGGPLWLVGGAGGETAAQIDPERLQRYEQLAHEVIVEHGVTALCLFDAGAMPDPLIASGRETHPLVLEQAGLRRNPDFVWAGP